MVGLLPSPFQALYLLCFLVPVFCLKIILCICQASMRVAVFVLNSFQFVNLMMKFEYKLSTEYKLKHRYDNYLIKLGLYVSGIKRLKLV